MPATAQHTDYRVQIQQIKDLPPMPVIAQELLKALSDETVSVGQLSAIIEQDPSLAARLIGLANSAFFGTPGAIHSVQDAIIRNLGFNTVRSIALGIALAGPFRQANCPGLSLERYWSSAALTATLASLAAPHVRVDDHLDASTAYLGGLLHNIGLLALAHSFPDRLSEVFSAVAEQQELTLSNTLRMMLGIDHREAGGWLARKWRLPGNIVNVIEHHHLPFYRQDDWPLCALTGFCARWAANWIEGVDEIPEDPELLQALDLPLSRLRTIHDRCAERMEEIMLIGRQLASG